MINLFIEIIILFANPHDSNNWLRALVLAVGLTALSLLPNYMGMIGWLVAIVAALALISKLIGQSLAGSLLFLMIFGLAQYIIQLGIYKLV